MEQSSWTRWLIIMTYNKKKHCIMFSPDDDQVSDVRNKLIVYGGKYTYIIK